MFQEKVGFLTLKMKIIILFLICLVLADGAAIGNVEVESDGAAIIPGRFIQVKFLIFMENVPKIFFVKLIYLFDFTSFFGLE